jgi:hypothetical protein
LPIKGGNQLGERLKKPLTENAVYLNFSKAIGLQTNKGNSHTYFVSKAINESPNIRNFYYEVLNSKFSNLTDKAMFNKHKGGLRYEIVK